MQLPGPKVNVKNKSKIDDIWGSLFDLNILRIIVDETNKTIDSESSHFFRARDILPTNIDEIRALIGLLYLAGVRKASHLNTTDLWNTDGTRIELF